MLVTPDNAERGSLGRVCLQFDTDVFQAMPFRSIGDFTNDNKCILLVSDAGANRTVTPRNMVWWKNGVRDLGLRHSHTVRVYAVRRELLVVELMESIGTDPNLPPWQPTLFG